MQTDLTPENIQVMLSLCDRENSQFKRLQKSDKDESFIIKCIKALDTLDDLKEKLILKGDFEGLTDLEDKQYNLTRAIQNEQYPDVVGQLRDIIGQLTEILNGLEGETPYPQPEDTSNFSRGISGWGYSD